VCWGCNGASVPWWILVRRIWRSSFWKGGITITPAVSGCGVWNKESLAGIQEAFEVGEAASHISNRLRHDMVVVHCWVE
jgi:hypothetical protein